MPLQHCLATVRDRLAQSRFFTVSLVLHLILVAVLGGVVLIKQTTPPPDMQATILAEANPPAPPRPEESVNKSPSIDKSLTNPGTTFNPVIAPEQLRSQNPSPQIFDPFALPGPPAIEIGALPQPPSRGFSDQMSPAERKAVGDFTKWREPSRGKDAYSFTAFLGRYQGGNWNSTVRVQNGEITGGSLPNLLYAMSKWSQEKIKTNERKVKAIALDSPELLTARPPFIFLTGTRDFKLTEKEIENLRLYIRSGGAVWGDSSLPGRRSAFDTAFRREMSQVLSGGNQDFEPLPANHEIFAKGYYKQVKDAPAGINHSREPVEVLRWSGEIAVIHTINDYGDMWQVGLDKDGQIDTARDERGQYVALNPALWDYRGTYVRNLEQPAVEQSFRFGINMVLHLLTRWEDRLASPSPL